METLKRFLLKSALSAFRVELVGAGFDFTLTLTETQPLLLQGDRGLSRKGPEPKQACRLRPQGLLPDKLLHLLRHARLVVQDECLHLGLGLFLF